MARYVVDALNAPETKKDQKDDYQAPRMPQLPL